MEKQRDEIPDIVTEDRAKICDIISDMLDNPDEVGIYQTTKAFNRLEELVRTAKFEAVGWMYAEACLLMDAGKDPRKVNCAEILERAEKELICEWSNPHDHTDP